MSTAADFPTDSPAPRARTQRLPLVVAVAAILLALDQGTKFWAVAHLTGAEPVKLLGTFLQLELIYNPGAAFSFGKNATWIFAIIAAVMVVVLVRLSTRVQSLSGAVIFGLLLGGATTHLIDRLFREPGFGRGRVVDFINYNGWFIGNVADIALVLGFAVLILLNRHGTNILGEARRPDDAAAPTVPGAETPPGP